MTARSPGVAREVRFGIVVLAAGASRRLGRPKQLEVLDGRPVLRHVVDCAAATEPDQLVVVVGHMADAVAAVLHDAPCEVVHNQRAADGQSTSLAAGIAALRTDIDRAVIVLGDQPRLDRAVVAAVAAGEGPIRRARYRDRPGHPVAFDREVWENLRQLTGDEGARSLLGDLSNSIRDVHVDTDAPIDLDTDADARALGTQGAAPS